MQKFLGSIQTKASGLGPRQIRVIASTETTDRYGDIMDMKGANLSAFRSNPVILANHDPAKPIGNADVSIVGNTLRALISFAPKGASPTADEWCALAKEGVINACSIGFVPTKSEPIKGGGLRFLVWELMEISLVSVPANAEALVVERSHRSGAPAVDMEQFRRRARAAAIQ